MNSAHVNSRTRIVILALSLLITPFALATAQYSIDRFVIGGGGGTSTGGVFRVNGTVGMPDAGKLSGGSYALEGGYWSVIAAIQTSGAPLLGIQRSGASSVVVSWPAPAEEWVLQWTPTLDPRFSQWTSIAPPYSTNAAGYFLTVPMPVGNRFYRLTKP